MGNSQSNVINEEYTKYIEQQKKIIEEQKSEIDKLRGINRPRDEMKVTGERSELLTHKEKIQVLLDIFELPIDYDDKQLKKRYIKLAMIHHPDHGGERNNFNKLQEAYNYLLHLLKNKDNHKLHNEFKKDNNDYIINQTLDNKSNVNLSKNFNNTLFNKIYNDNRGDDIYDKGYGDWMKKTEFTTDKISKEDINESNFNHRFEERKKEIIKGSKLIEYSEPKVDISYRGKDSIVTLGTKEINNFSGESSGGLQFRDYKDAYTNTLLIDTKSIDLSKRSKNIKQQNLERKNISYKMSKEDEKKKKLLELIQSKEEEERIKRLNLSDEKAFNTYDAIHMRMLGQ